MDGASEPDTTSSIALLPKALPFLHVSSSGALYYELPAPHSHIILTGPDPPSDAPEIVKAFNDPVIYRWTVGSPYPYLLEHAQEQLWKNVKTYDSTLGQMCENAARGEEIKVDQTPLRFIRAVQPDGSWVFVGDIGLTRHSFSEVHSVEERGRLLEENNARTVGDENVVWMIGDYLIPSYHGQGIMTSAIRTVIYTWAVPLMNCRTIRALILRDNWGSKRVFEKLGFVLIDTTDGGVPMQGKRDMEVGVWTMEWKYEGE